MIDVANCPRSDYMLQEPSWLRTEAFDTDNVEEIFFVGTITVSFQVSATVGVISANAIQAKTARMTTLLLPNNMVYADGRPAKFFFNRFNRLTRSRRCKAREVVTSSYIMTIQNMTESNLRSSA
jgi:hypothetical protein